MTTSPDKLLRKTIVLAILLLPVLVGLVFWSAESSWDRSLRELVNFTTKMQEELPQELEASSKQEREKYQVFYRLIEETNPVALTALFVIVLLLYCLFFFQVWIVCLLYLFFALYAIQRKGDQLSSQAS